MENASTMTEQEITDIFYENDIKLQEKNLTVMCIQSEEKKEWKKLMIFWKFSSKRNI